MPRPRNGWTLCTVTPSQYREQVSLGLVRKGSWKKLNLTLVLRHNEHRNREGKNIPGRDSMDAEKLTVRSEDEEWTDSASGEELITHGDINGECPSYALATTKASRGWKQKDTSVSCDTKS